MTKLVAGIVTSVLAALIKTGGMSMRTVKEVSDLTGISIRMLHYYDKIGLLKPSEVTDAGYRLYNDKALETLQQILFYKELDIPLKEVSELMTIAHFDKTQVLENQKKLLILKRKRLTDLINLIDRSLKGEDKMSFKEFDMSEYFIALDEFRKEHGDKIIRAFGSMEKYDELIEGCRSKEAEIAKMAVTQYGSIEKYITAMKNNFDSDIFTIAEQSDTFKKDCLEDKHPELKKLFKKLVSDLSKDSSSKEVQQIASEITNTVKKDYELFRADMGGNLWYQMINSYLMLPEWIKAVDAKYGAGASKFIGEALKNNLGGRKPKIETLYEKLVSDLSKDPSAEEIQGIIAEIANETKKQHETLKIDDGQNYWGYMAELYLSNASWIKATDNKYGNGVAEFIGKALKFYSENNK